MVTVCPSQFATRRTLFHVLVGCGLLMLKVSRLRSEERFSRNAETDLVCRLLLEKKHDADSSPPLPHFFSSHSPPPPQTSPLSLHDALPISNFGRRVRNRRQLNSLQNTWPYGYSMPIAVRYTQDAFSRSGWLWPVDAKGEPLKATSYMAVGFYVAKYVNKKSDMDLA